MNCHYLMALAFIAFTAFFFNISASVADTAAEKEQKLLQTVEKSGEAIWPANILSAEERKARFAYFVRDKNYSLSNHGSATDETKCDALLTRLTNGQLINFLSPYTFEDPGQGYEKKLHGQCPALFPLSYHFKTGDKDIDRNPAFTKLSWEEQRKFADATLFPTAQVEYYDFSPYLGSGEWGIIGNGVMRDCGLHKECPSGFNPAFLAQANERTCTLSRFSYGIGSVGGISHKFPLGIYDQDKDKESITLRTPKENPSFSSFIEMDKKIYFLGIASDYPWSNFSHILKDSGVIVTPLSPVASTPNEQSCHFVKRD